jgi:AcrR family transcriptional regulator
MIVELHRKERIIFTAIDVINELGVQALSTKRVAALEGISESTVFKHFSSKSKLLQGVLDYYKKYDLDLTESTNIMHYKGLESIRFLIRNYLNYYENYPAITAITQGLEEFRYSDELVELVDDIVGQRHRAIAELILEAQSDKVISSGVIPEIAAELIWGGITGCIRNWRSSNFTYSLVERGEIYLEYMIGGMVKCEMHSNSKS